MMMMPYGQCCFSCSVFGCLIRLSPVQGAAPGKVKSLQDYESYPRQFVIRRLIVFVGIVVG